MIALGMPHKYKYNLPFLECPVHIITTKQKATA